MRDSELKKTLEKLDIPAPSEEGKARALQAALPECLVFAQVPIARFLRVPTRHSYGDWLARVAAMPDYVPLELRPES